MKFPARKDYFQPQKQNHCDPVFGSISSVIHRKGYVLNGRPNTASAINTTVNTLRPRQNVRRFPDVILEWIFVNENAWITIKISLFVPRGPNNIIPALVQIMAWRQPGDKASSEPMMTQVIDVYMHLSASLN